MADASNLLSGSITVNTKNIIEDKYTADSRLNSPKYGMYPL